MYPLAGFGQAITSDGTLGTSVSNAGNAFTIAGGTTAGTNLFHSFGAFSVPTGGSATFNGPQSTTNIISRVTGNAPSTIDGPISSRAAMPNANFFLLNPAGVMFGASASLDVGGSAYFSTADRLIFPDQFFSTAPQANELALLSSAPPQAFGFATNPTAGIDVNGAQLVSADPRDGLGPRTLSLVGGPVTVRGGSALVAPGGTIQLVSVASPGTVGLSSAQVSSTRLGLVRISDGSTVTAGGSEFGLPVPGGAVVIRSGQLIVETGALVVTDTSNFGAQPVGVDIQASESVVVNTSGSIQTKTSGIDDASSISVTTANLTLSGGGALESGAITGATGKSGAISVQVDSAHLSSGGKIRTAASGTAAGNVTLVATGTVSLSGQTTEIATSTGALGADILAGDISITAADVVLTDRARIRSGGAGVQGGKKLAVAATNKVEISALAGILSQGFSGEAGAIEITTPRLAMDAGFINASTFGAGGAGTIDVKAGSVSLLNGAQIASNTQNAATSQAGNITLEAGSVTISGRGPATGSMGSVTFTNDRSSGIFSTSSTTGTAGSIALLTPALTLADGGKISVTTTGVGGAGSIAANVGAAAITGGGRIDSSTSGAGAGGAINLNGTTAITGAGSGLFSTASGSGNAGVINVTGTTVLVADGGTIDSSTTGAGSGGAINVNAGSQVEISRGGSVRADSLGTGNTGSITIAAGDRILMEGGSVSTRAATADGGNIALLAPNVIRLRNSQVTTSVQSGTGSGGNIFIDPQFMLLEGSSITANAFGGPGGNITIIANNFLADAASSVQASSALSTPGTVQIQSPDNNVASDVAQLPRELVDASRLMAAACSARRAGTPSSFMVAGRGGVPADPDGYLPAYVTDAASRTVRAPGLTLAMAGLDCAR
jgi:filamentous hemagglutinin family protein